MIRKPMAIAQRPLYIQAPPIRDENYKRWIRSWPCLVCARRFAIEAAHTGPHGTGQKASDLNTIPLCKEHHADLHRGVLDFQERHGINIADAVAMFNAVWDGRKKAA
jgi:sugar phosphate isomerase/epimerase